MQLSDGYVTTERGVRLFFQKMGSGPTVIVPNGIYLSGDLKCLADGHTVIFYDARNRGRSDPISDGAKLARGIHNDVDDLEAVRLHFGISRVDVIAHSYMGTMLGLYAMKYPACVHRIVQMGPMPPDAAKQYPAHLTGADATLDEVLSKLAQLQKERVSADQQRDPKEACEKFWSVLRPIYVVNPSDAQKINWGRCDLPKELNFMRYWSAHILPSIQNLHLSAGDFANVKTPVLVVHGARDRSSPYGGGRDWAMMFPNARLLTVENAAHAPWIEAPEMVFGSIVTFLSGKWPAAARKVKSSDT